jgi:hypothetical protein
MEQLKSTAEFLRKQLAEVEEKMRALNQPAAPVAVAPAAAAPVCETMTIEEMRAEIAKMATAKKWKSFVNKPYGVVDNVIDILDTCYDPFVDSIVEGYPGKKPQAIIGRRDSAEWQKFQLRVIKRLLHPSDFDADEDFSDTANGCDEIAWDAGVEVIAEVIAELTRSP